MIGDDNRMKWFENIKISKKLIVGFLLVAILAAVVGVVGVFNINSIRQSDTQLYQEDTMGLQYAGDAGVTFQQIRYNCLKIVYLDKTETSSIKETAEAIEEYSDKLDGLLTQCGATITDSQIKSHLNEI